MNKCCFCDDILTLEDLRDEICNRCWNFEVLPDKIDRDDENNE